MSESHQAHVREVVGGDVTFTAGGRRKNQHGPAAAERLIVERMVLKEFENDCRDVESPVLLDVYSNAVRISNSRDLLGINVRLEFLIPHVVPNDLDRQRKAHDAGLTFMDVKLDDLPPLGEGQEPRFHAFNFTHSLYYVDPCVLMRVMVEQKVFLAYSTMHDFVQGAASLCAGTVQYHYGNDALIKCRADGDPHVYHHSPCHWLQSPGINVSLNGEPWCLVWSVVDRVGDTFLRRFELRPGTVPEVPLFPDLDLLDTADSEVHPLGSSLNFVTVMNRELKSPTIDLAYVPIVDAVFFFGLMGFTTEQGKFIPVPRGLIGSLRLQAAGQPRCPALYQLLLARAKNSITGLNFPAEMAPEIAVYAAVIALVLDVEFETAALGTNVRMFRRIFGRHARVLDFEPVYLYTGRQALGAAAMATTTLVPAHYYGYDAMFLSLVKAIGTAAVFHPFVAIPAAMATAGYAYSTYSNLVSHQSDAAKSWLAFRANLAPGPVGRTIEFKTPPAFQQSYRPKTPEGSPLKEGARLTIHGNPEAMPARGLTRKGLVLCGIGIQEITPSYIGRTVDNAVQGLRSRVLGARKYESDPWAWFVLYRKVTDPNSVLSRLATGPLRNYNDGTFEHWVSRFPGSVQTALREAKESLVGRPLEDKDMRVQGITKQEKTGFLDVSGEPPVTDARIVLSCTPRCNVVLGPYHWSVSNVLKRRFHAQPGKYLVWSCGETAEELGAWYDWAVDEFSTSDEEAEILIWDQSRFDKNQGDDSYRFERVTFIHSGAPQDVLDADKRLKTVRGSMQGMPVTFSVDDPQRVSGGADTSVGSFKVNCASVVHAYGEPGPGRYAMAIKGDDVVAVGKKGVFSKVDGHARVSQLGLDVDLRVVSAHERHKVEFASAIPYPTADGTVWGPKIGRVLHRFGWTLSGATADVYGAATSLRETVNHIPFLRQFIETHRRLADPSDKRYFKFKLLAAHPHESSAETYDFIYMRYGLTPQLEVAFQELMDGVVKLPSAISWPLIDHLVAIDQ